MTLSQEQLNNKSAGSFEDWLREARSGEFQDERQRPISDARAPVEDGRRRRTISRDGAASGAPGPSLRRQIINQSANAPKLRSEEHIDRKVDAGRYRPAHLRPLPTGEELKALRRPLLVKRFFYLTAISVVAFSVLTGVIAQAEIGKMSLSIASYNSTITSLKSSNQQLGLTEASLGSPARIAQYAQSKLHMTFATSSGVASNSHLSLYSSSSQPYSEYYTPAGEAPTTTLAPGVSIQPSQTQGSLNTSGNATTGTVRSTVVTAPTASTATTVPVTTTTVPVTTTTVPATATTTAPTTAG